MELVGTQMIPASMKRTWEALNDPGTLKACITGCDAIERVEDNQFLVSMTARIGPVSARFKGRLALADLQPPTSYTIHFDGQGGVAGFGKGSASVKLTPAGDNTRLEYSAQAQIGGKIAQLGSRLIDSAARKLAGDFFAAFNEKMVSDLGLAPPESEAASTGPADSGWVARLVEGTTGLVNKVVDGIRKLWRRFRARAAG